MTTSRSDKVRQGATVRGRLWIFGNEANNQDPEWGLPGISRMTAAEGAMYLNVPNLVMVSHNGLPAPPLDQHAIALRPLKRVVWSIVHSGGVTSEEDRDHVLDIAARFPNFTGVFLDDFFYSSEDGEVSARLSAGEVGARLSVEELGALRDRLQLPDRKLDLWVVLYTRQFDLPLHEHLAVCDKVNFWTSRAQELRDLEGNFARLEALYPEVGKVQGLYMWDFYDKRPVPVDLMQMQCEMGLRWLREGRIEGMVFLASCMCDLEIETVEWTRAWIGEVGDQAL